MTETTLTVANGGLVLGAGWAEDPDKPLLMTRENGIVTLRGRFRKVRADAGAMPMRIMDPDFMPQQSETFTVQGGSLPPCPLCHHPHGPPFDFCRWPKDWHEGDPEPSDDYEMCGCSG